MTRMMRKIAAVLAGLLVGGVLIAVIEQIGSLLHPLPAGVDYTDREALRAHVEGAPLTAMLAVLAAYCIGPFFGGFLAGRIGQGLLAPLIVGIFFTVGGIANLIAVPGHPIWFAVVSLAVYIPAALLGGRLGMPKDQASGGR